jgi:hypothetical protein
MLKSFVAIICICFFATPVFADEILARKATITSVSESSVIEQAEAMMLKGDRIGALEHLRLARKSFSPGSKSYKNLKEKAEVVFKAFVSEKGQQLFQKAESLHYSGLASASDEYIAALKVEPEHPLVMLGIVRSELRNGKCSQASEYIKKLEQLYLPITDELLELSVRTELCLNNLDRAKALYDQITNKNQISSASLPAEILFKKLDWANLLIASQKMIANHPNFYESYFWLAQAKKNLAISFDVEQATYVEKCKKVDFNVRKSFVFYPELCKNIVR